MKKKIRLFAVVVLGLSAVSSVHAVSSRVGSAQDLGLGTELGQPMGVTAKYWLNSTLAVDAAMGYHFNSNFDMHSDILWHTFSSFAMTNGRMPFYAGLGGRVLLGNDSQFGLRLPLGASFLPATDPIEIFIELAPVIQVAPSLGADIDGIVGIRLYINYLR